MNNKEFSDLREAVAEALAPHLYEALMEVTADHWRQWRYLTASAREKYRRQAGEVLADALLPLIERREREARDDERQRLTAAVKAVLDEAKYWTGPSPLGNALDNDLRAALSDPDAALAAHGARVLREAADNDDLVQAFRVGWEAADARGEAGGRVKAGLRALADRIEGGGPVAREGVPE